MLRAAGVAHGGAQAARELVDDGHQAALVGHAAFDAFGHELLELRGGVLEIAIGRAVALGHGAERAHAAIRLVRRALVELDVARRFFGAGEQAADHHAVGARRQSPWRCRRRSGCRRRRSTGTPLLHAPRRRSATAEICGTPTPATMRVVQMEPGPMPTLMPSTPAFDEIARRVGGGDVAADDLQVAPLRLDARDRVEHALGVAVRGVDDDHVDAGLAQRRDALEVSCAVPTAAPTRRRPDGSLQARGNSVAFWKSFTVIMPRSSWSPFTTSTFSMRCLCSSSSTSSFGAFSRTVTRRSFGVMTVDTGASSFTSKRRSRCVTMPTTLRALHHRHAGDAFAIG